MSNYTADWFSKNIPTWTKLLADLKSSPLNILEIGCFEGRATVWLLETLPECRITAIDPFVETEEYKKYGGYDHNYEQLFRENVRPYGIRVEIIKGNSFDWLRDLSKMPRYDLVYVDGSHQAVSVLQDIVLSWEMLKEGGIMICDDYEWGMADDRPRIAIDAFMNVYKGKYTVINKGYQIAFKKLPRVAQ